MRTTTILPSAVALGAIAGASFAGGAGGGQVYSNFARFGNGDVSIGQASAVTGANAPIVTPFESNTASMRVSLDQAAAITTVSVLSDIQYLPDQASARPGSGLHAEGGADLGGGRGPAGVSGPVDLGAMRVSFYASAADAAARLTYASVDFDASSVLMGAWD